MQINMLDEYKNTINEIVEISKKTTKENSLLYHFKILDFNATFKISLVEKDGKEQIIKDISMQKNDTLLQEFIIPLIKKFSDVNQIILYDIIDMDEDNKTTYRLITDNNDLLTIDGLSFQDTNYISDVVDEIKRSKIALPADELLHINDVGKANFMIVILLALLIGLIGSIIYFS